MKRQTKRAGRGYTVVEVLVAISLLIIASSGIVALQKVTTQGNGHARELAVATQFARTWVERLRTDATVWNFSPKAGQTSDLNQTIWLRNVDTSPLTWFRPAPNVLGSPGADLLGNDVPQASLTSAFYCANVRLAWMFPDEVIRADVRVAWRRTNNPGATAVCDPAQDGNMSRFDDFTQKPLAFYNFTYLTSAITRNKAQLQ